jgi:hypothetical protein
MTLVTSIQDSWNQLERWAGRQISGARNEARLISARADALQLAITLSEGLAVYRILRDFQHLDLDAVVNDIVAVLRQCLIVMLTSTGGGALIGGVAGGVFGVGVGAAPGVVIGAAAGAQMGEWILIFMGLKALSEYIVRDMPDIARAYWDGIRLAWSAASPSPLPQQPIRVDRFAIQHAAEKIARAHVAMFVLLLMGILAYLAKGRGDMGQLAEGVRSSRMGPKFADWMVRNEGRLKAEPWLRPERVEAPKGSSPHQESPAIRSHRTPEQKPAIVATTPRKAVTRSERIAAARLRQHQLLLDNIGYNVSPISWDQYPTIGRGGTFVSDKKAITDILGDINGRTEINLTRMQASKMEGELGLEPGSLQNGFKLRQVTNLMDMAPSSPLEGNAYFLGPGNHLPGGGPELVIRSIPTTDNTMVKTILTGKVKP